MLLSHSSSPEVTWVLDLQIFIFRYSLCQFSLNLCLNQSFLSTGPSGSFVAVTPGLRPSSKAVRAHSARQEEKSHAMKPGEEKPFDLLGGGIKIAANCKVDATSNFASSALHDDFIYKLGVLYRHKVKTRVLISMRFSVSRFWPWEARELSHSEEIQSMQAHFFKSDSVLLCLVILSGKLYCSMFNGWVNLPSFVLFLT